MERNIVTCVRAQARVSVKIRPAEESESLDPLSREEKCTKARNFPR